MSMYDRELEVLRRLSRHRYLSRSQIEAFLFQGATLSSGSKDVLTRRVLTRLKTAGLISALPRLVGGPGGGSARLGYFLTEAGARLAGGARPLGAARRRGRGTFLLAHSLMGADIALAFERSACSRQGHKLLEWESSEQTAERLRGSRIVPDARLVPHQDHPPTFRTRSPPGGHYAREHSVPTREAETRKRTTPPAARLGVKRRGVSHRSSAPERTPFPCSRTPRAGIKEGMTRKTTPRSPT